MCFKTTTKWTQILLLQQSPSLRLTILLMPMPGTAAQKQLRGAVRFVLQVCHFSFIWQKFLNVNSSESINYHVRPLHNVITGNNIAPKTPLKTLEEDCGVGLESGFKNKDGTSTEYNIPSSPSKFLAKQPKNLNCPLIKFNKEEKSWQVVI